MRPLVSVCIVTFQHAAFIAKALDGALLQKTDFPFEILVGEDESTDGTREVCLDYARRFPNRVRVLLHSRRDVVHIDGRARGSFNFRMTLREAQGEFIALCEGDDYWTDPEKLQRQVDYLRANSDCAGCFHDVKLVNADDAILQESYFASDQEKFSQRDVLTNLLSRQPTCSMVFRKTAFAEPLPAWYLRRPCDFYLDILLTMQGQLGFVRRNMGVYRKHGGGVWSSQREANRIIELIIRLKLLLADSYFLETYREELLRKIDELQSALFTRDDYDAEMRRLEQIVQEQTNAVQAIDADRRRLVAESDRASANAQQLAKDAQKHIDDLLAQLQTLSATTNEQAFLINRFKEDQRDAQKHIDDLLAQLQTLSATANEQVSFINRLKEDQQGAQKHIDDLFAQLQTLSSTAQEQASLINRLKEEQRRLRAENKTARETAKHVGADYQKQIDKLLQQLTELTEVSRAQAVYISKLEKQREQEHGSEKHLVNTLRQQLDKLATTSVEQNQFIALLKKECDRLNVAESNQQREVERLGRIIAEQTAYIQQQERGAEQRVNPLRHQLDALAATSAEQDQFIALLKKECNRLVAVESSQQQEIERLERIVAEQTVYIEQLIQPRSPAKPVG